MPKRFLLLTLFALSATPAMADSPAKCLAQAIYEESRGEPVTGMRGVGSVVLNRFYAGEYGADICSIVYSNDLKDDADGLHIRCEFAFVCSGQPNKPVDVKAMIVSHYIAEELLAERLTDNTGGATHFASSPLPSWFREAMRVGNIVKTATIAHHIFFRASPKSVRVSFKGSW